MKPHFEKIKNNIKTDKRLLPDLQVLCQHLHSFDKNSYVSTLKTCMRSVSEGIANIQLREYEPNFDQAVPYIDFKEKIKKIQNYNPNLSKALHFVRKLANEGSKTTVPGSNMILNEHDSLAEMFNRLTEALGIFFKASSDSALQKSKFSPGPTTVEQYYQNSVASLGSNQPSYQHFPTSSSGRSSPVPSPIQTQYQNFLNSTSPSQQSSYAFPTSLTPVQLYQSQSSMTTPLQQYQNFPNNSLQTKFNQQSTQSNFNSTATSLTDSNSSMSLVGGRYSPNIFGGFDSFNGDSHKNQQNSFGSSQPNNFQNGSGLSFKPFFPANNSLYTVAEKVCLNCGAINSHTSAQCRGCGWCGRTNHVVDQCTSKLPRCGYCSKQQNKGLGHKTCDCRYLLSSGKGI
jgi:ribosomal protein L40E